MPAALASLKTPARLDLAENASLFREECALLDHLASDLYADIERLGDELLQKADELEAAREQVTERGRKLASERKENARLIELLEAQQSQLDSALTEIRSLRDQAAKERQEAQERDSTRFAALEQSLTATAAERDQLLQELRIAQASAKAYAGELNHAELLAPLFTEIAELQQQVKQSQSSWADTKAELTATIEQSIAALPSVADPLPTLLTELAEIRTQVKQSQTAFDVTKTELTSAINQSLAAIPSSGDPTPALVTELAELRKQITQSQTHLNELKAEFSTAWERSSAPAAAVQELSPQFATELAEIRRQIDQTHTQLDDLKTQLAAVHNHPAVSDPATAEALPAIASELGELRQQLGQTLVQLDQTKLELTAAIEQSATPGVATSDPMPLLLPEFKQMRELLSDTQTQLGEARVEIYEAIERSAAAVAEQAAKPATMVPVTDETSRAKIAALELERHDLETELELLRARASELQTVNSQQKRELAEQRSEVTSELRVLRELLTEQSELRATSDREHAVVSAATHEANTSEPDPVVSSVMAQFARLQKDVAQRRKKK